MSALEVWREVSIHLADVIVHYLWVGTSVFGIAFSLRALLRRASPSVRHATALFLLGVLFATPFLISAVLLSRDVSLPPETDGETARLVTGAVPMRVETVSRAVAVAEARPTETRPWTAMRPWLSAVWLLGASLLLLRHGVGLLGVRRLAGRGSAPLDASSLMAQLAPLAVRVGVGRQVAVRLSESVTGPMVLGVLRPLILIPPAVIAGLTPQQVELILLHELAHVRRFDVLVNGIQRVGEALLFFHPGVWWVSQWVRREREHCCDALVIAHTHRPKLYAKTLLQVASHRAFPKGAMAMADGPLLQRVRAVVCEGESTMSVTRVVVAVLGLVLSLSSLAVLSAQSAPYRRAAASTSGGALREAEQEYERLQLLAAWISSVKREGEACRGATTSARCTDCHVAPKTLTGTVTLGQESPHKPSPPMADCAACHTNGTGDLFGQKSLTLCPSLKTIVAAQGEFSPSQATGAPNTTTNGASPSAWAPAVNASGTEWIELEFAKSVAPSAVVVHESSGPGAVGEIIAFPEGDKKASLTLWKGQDPAPKGQSRWTSVFPAQRPAKTKKIVLRVDPRVVQGCFQIDAVGLMDAAGQVHWAQSARASSTYSPPTTGRVSGERSPDELHRAIRELRAKIRKIEQELERHEKQRAPGSVR